MISLEAVTGIGEVRAGDDLASMLAAAYDLHDGDVVVVTSKVVSKAEGRVVTGVRDEAIARETDRVVARRGQTSIVRTRHGLVMAAAGIDASNTAPGTLALLPVDPDASARALREALLAGTGTNVAVVVTDTSGRAWRNGQTDIAVGAAGLVVLDDHAGRDDGYGNRLAVTAPALADEVAAAADLVTGKLSRSPFAVVRGLAHLVSEPGRHGTGAAALVRAEDHDMFGLGSREAVLHALLREDGRGFGSPVPAEELAAALQALLRGDDVTVDADSDNAEVTVSAGPDPSSAERARVLAFSLGWRALLDGGPEAGRARDRSPLRFRPSTT